MPTHISIPPQGTTYYVCFIAKQHDTMFGLSQLNIPWSKHPMQCHLPWYPPSLLVLFSLKEVKLSQHTHSYVSFLLFEKDTRCFAVVNLALSLFLESSIHWHYESSGFKSIILSGATLHYQKFLQTLPRKMYSLHDSIGNFSLRLVIMPWVLRMFLGYWLNLLESGYIY